MNHQKIKVSVIMACHNSSLYLDESVKSILNQTLRDLELILVDDCSVDNTLEIARRYELQDRRVRVLALPVNSGPSAARNAGIQIAEGRWIGILDSDDIALPSRFEEQISVADCTTDVVMIGSSSITIDGKGKTVRENRYPRSNRELVKRLESHMAFFPHSSITYRSSAIESLSAFNPRYVQSEDYDLWLRLAEIGQLTSIAKPLVKIRKHESNISRSEGGMLQIRFGYAAAICHFLRRLGVEDPSATNDEAEWAKFIAWVDGRLREEGVFERRKAWEDARAMYFATQNRMAGTSRFATHILKSGYGMALLWEKGFGSTLSRRLAKVWRQVSCAAS